MTLSLVPEIDPGPPWCFRCEAKPAAVELVHGDFCVLCLNELVAIGRAVEEAGAALEEESYLRSVDLDDDWDERIRRVRIYDKDVSS